MSDSDEGVLQIDLDRPEKSPSSSRSLKEKRLRGSLKVIETDEEIEFRKYYSGVNVIRNFPDLIKCTKCMHSFKSAIFEGKKIHTHPILQVLMCESCCTFYGNGEFSLDEDDEDKYCRWCGEGGKIFLCSECICGFCPTCIKKHFGKKKVREIERDDEWVCFICNPKPIWKLRAICRLAIEQSTQNKTKNDSLEGETPKKKLLKLRNSKQNTLTENVSCETGRNKGNSNNEDSSASSRDTQRDSTKPSRNKRKRFHTSNGKGKEKTPTNEQSDDGVAPPKKRRSASVKRKEKVRPSESRNDSMGGDSKVSSSSSDSSDDEYRNNVTATVGESNTEEAPLVSRVKDKDVEKLKDLFTVTETVSELCLKMCRKKIKKLDRSSMTEEKLLAECEKLRSMIILMSCSLSTAHNMIASLQKKRKIKEQSDLPFPVKHGSTLLEAFGKILRQKKMRNSCFFHVVSDILNKYPFIELGSKSFYRYIKNIVFMDSAMDLLKNCTGDEGAETLTQDDTTARDSDATPGTSGRAKLKTDSRTNVPNSDGKRNVSRKNGSPGQRPGAAEPDALILTPSPSHDSGASTSSGIIHKTSLLKNNFMKSSDDISAEGEESMPGNLSRAGRAYKVTKKEKREVDSGSSADEDREIARLMNLSYLERRRRRRRAGVYTDSENADSLDELFSDRHKRKGTRAPPASCVDDSLSDSQMDTEVFWNTSGSDRMDADVYDTSSGDVNFTPDHPSIFQRNIENGHTSMAKGYFLQTSSSNEGHDDSSSDEKKPEKIKRPAKSSGTFKKRPVIKKEKSKWRSDNLLRCPISFPEPESSDGESDPEGGSTKNSTDVEEIIDSDSISCISDFRRTRRKRKIIVLSSSGESDIEELPRPPDSDIEELPRPPDSDIEELPRPRDSDIEELSAPPYSDIEELSAPFESDVEELFARPPKTKVESPPKGRRNIKKIVKTGNLQLETRQAVKAENERKKRIAERNLMYQEWFPSMVEGQRLVLDFDPNTMDVLLEVPFELARILKPHQKEGVKFMWDCCFESLDSLEKTNGSGCILAHCMGLGKTLQIISLIYTIMKNRIGIKTVLILCPMNVVDNWMNEFAIWLKNCDFKIDPCNLKNIKGEAAKVSYLEKWQIEGGVTIVSYDLIRSLTNTMRKTKTASTKAPRFSELLLNPGPDLVICDEGHLLKNQGTALSKCIMKINTSRRIILTGTPLQNNLIEYHSMIEFIKPNILGTRKEFMNRFGNPIINGQFGDSTETDVKLMRARSHVLHKLLDGCIQRQNYSVLTPYLPKKYEYVLKIRLTEPQIKLYRHYLGTCRRTFTNNKAAKLFNDFHLLQRIWTHPRLMISYMENEDNVDFDFDETRFNPPTPEDSVICVDTDRKGKVSSVVTLKELIKTNLYKDIQSSGKLIMLLHILSGCRKVGDKVLVFSQSLKNLNLIEYFLHKINSAHESASTDFPPQYRDTWVKGVDYYRMEGSTSNEDRTKWCKNFNNMENKRLRLFLISTKAGGLGINLVGANRVIVFDVSWNPSHDVQSIFRVYRFGQHKKCYIYRFVAEGTMEEKIYARQVTKLSLEKRVMDEQQIERHYTMGNLQELYAYDPVPKEKWKVPLVPKDMVLAEIINNKNLIASYLEHDTLLENKEEEKLTEEERKSAWEDFEKERFLAEFEINRYPPSNDCNTCIDYSFPSCSHVDTDLYLASSLDIGQEITYPEDPEDFTVTCVRNTYFRRDNSVNSRAPFVPPIPYVRNYKNV